MTGLDPARETSENYRAFARFEAAGRSLAYEELANAVASDDLVLRFLASLPPLKRQPNLLFASARVVLGAVPTIGDLRDLVTRHREDLAGVILARRTQTNEVGRCATLLPALARISGPLALIEVGASAGLALLMDRYSYDYDGRLLRPDEGGPLLRCRVRGAVPIPAGVPEVIWRHGLDLHPLDVTDDDDVAWLRCLIWPGQPEREERLLAAVETARKDPPVISQGDLLEDLPAVVAQAPADATVVVFHSAVLAYVDPATRRAFANLIHELGVRWLSNEGLGVLPELDLPARDGAPFVLVQDGTHPLAFTDPHGEWIEWLTSDRNGTASSSA